MEAERLEVHRKKFKATKADPSPVDFDIFELTVYTAIEAG
jgi:hypothetical protein